MTVEDEPVSPAQDPAGSLAAGSLATGSPAAGSPAPVAAPPRSRIGRWWWAIGIAIAALVVIVLAPLASSDPDGLERVAEDQGFIERAQNFFSGLLGDYAIPGVDNEWLSTILAGLLGVVIVVAIVLILGRVVARRRAQD
jgi:ABC-type Fe3+ transport system permease subunit